MRPKSNFLLISHDAGSLDNMHFLLLDVFLKRIDFFPDLTVFEAFFEFGLNHFLEKRMMDNKILFIELPLGLGGGGFE